MVGAHAFRAPSPPRNCPLAVSPVGISSDSLLHAERDIRSICGWRFTNWCKCRSALSTRPAVRLSSTTSCRGGLYLQLVFISAYLYFEFLVAFLALRRRWYIKALRYTAPILAFIGPTILLVGHNKAIGVALIVILVSAIFWVIGWAIFVFLTLIIATIKRNFEAGLLLIPLVLTMVGIIEPFLSGGMVRPGRGHVQVSADDPGGADSNPLRGDRGLCRTASDYCHHLRALPSHSPRAGAGQRRTGGGSQRARVDDSTRKGGDSWVRGRLGLQPCHRSGWRLFPYRTDAGWRSPGDSWGRCGQRPAGSDECVDADGRAAAYIREKPGADSGIAQSRSDRERQLYDLPGLLVWAGRRGCDCECRAICRRI